MFECLLGLAGQKLGNRYKVASFDEIYGKEASRILVNQKLKQASLETNQTWLFNKYHPGKILLRDGRTGEYFDNPITVGKSYILKLILPYVELWLFKNRSLNTYLPKMFKLF